MKKSNEDMEYEVIVLRRDQEHMRLLVTKEFKEAKEVWQDARVKWTEAVRNNEPIYFEKPLITTFDPGLIYEIVCQPVNQVNNKVDEDNPYQQQMKSNGFGAMQNYSGGEVLDNGYR